MKNLVNKLLRINIEKWVWCMVIVLFCWTEVVDYYYMNNCKKHFVWAILIFYYVYKNSFAMKKNRILTGVCVMGGIFLTWYMVHINYFYDFCYYNYSVGILCTALIPQYVLLFKSMLMDKKLPNFSWTSILTLLMMGLTQFSPDSDKKLYMLLLVIYLPFACYTYTEKEQKAIFHGIVNGLCLGFILCQGYTFLYRPYVLQVYDYRFTNYRNAYTAAGMVYIQFFTAYLLKYIMAAKERKSLWGRSLYVVISAFIISLTYLTGGRAPVLGMMGITAIFVWYLCKEKRWFVAIPVWFCKCAVIGVLSLVLFPAAYAGTRYLPTILNAPDYVDASGNRINSYAVKQELLYHQYNYEYEDVYFVREGEDKNSPKYVTFHEALGEAIGRIVPGLDDLVYRYYKDEIFIAQMERILYIKKTEPIDENEFWYKQDRYCYQYRTMHGEYDEELLLYYQNEVQKLLEEETTTSSKEEAFHSYPVEKYKSPVGLMRVYASDTGEALPGRGESPETGWSESGYSDMGLRMAIHEFAARHLNWFGHDSNDFRFYFVKGSENVLGHAHNIFLIYGYDYGILAMNALLLLFLVLGLKSWRVSTKTKEPLYLLAIGLIVGTSIFGLFEMGYTADYGVYLFVAFCGVLLRNPSSKNMKKRYSC